MAIQLSDSILVGQQKPVEDKYYNQLSPYSSTAEVNSLLLSTIRYRGLTVNVSGVEYWYKDGIADTDLVVKISDPLPTQTGNSGRFLTTNGTSTSWEYVLNGTGFVKVSGTTITYDNSTYQPQLNGTGFVKVSGTTITYDNSTYLTTAILSLNGLTNSTQTFATGTTGTNFNISSASGVHTFNIPDASATARGLITTGNQTISGSKTFSSAPTFSSILSGGVTQFRLLATNSAGLLNNTPGLIWDSNIGGLGIGNTPLYALDVSGSARINTQLYLTGSLTDSTSFTGIKMLTRRTSDGLTMLQDIPSLTAGSSNHAQYFSYTTQSATANNEGKPMFFETVDMSVGITVVSDGTALTKITFGTGTTGRYNLQFSTQFQNADNAQHDVNIWLRKGNATTAATDVVGSTGLVSIPARKSAGAGNEGHVIAGWNFLLDIIAGDFYQIVWSTSSISNVTIQYYAGNPPPPTSATNYPSTASTLFTVTQVEGILGGSGVQSIQGISPATAVGNYGLVPDNDASILGGTDFNISYGPTPLQVPGNIYFYIPTLGTGKTRGLITNAAQTIGGAKTFSAAPILSTTTANTLLISNASKTVTSYTSVTDGMLKIASNQPAIVTGLSNTITYWQNSGTIGSLDTATYPNLTELSYVKGVTSSIQTQLNSKLTSITLTTTGTSGAATYASNTLNIPQYQGQISLTTTGTSGAATFIGNVLNIPQYQGGVTQIIAGSNITISPTGGTGAVTINGQGYSFSTGLTNTGGTITNNLSTGIAGSQIIIGSISSGGNLILSSTSSATKGIIYIGQNSSLPCGYNEATANFGIGINPTSTYRLDVLGGATRLRYNGTTDPILYVSGSNAGFANVLLENPSTSSSANIAIKFLNNLGGANYVGQISATGSNASSANRFILEALYTSSDIEIGSRSGNVDINTSNIGVSNTKLRVFNNGNVAIGTNPSDTGFKFKVNGSISFPSLSSSTQTNVIGYNTTTGQLTYQAAGGGGGTPASPTGSVQFNNAGSFGGDSNFTWDNTNKRLGIGLSPNVRLDVIGNDTNLNTAQFGTIGIQSYSVNNCWFGDNVYYNGTQFIRRENGYAGLFYFLYGEGQFRWGDDGLQGDPITNGYTGFGLVSLKTNLDGTFGVGNLAATAGDFSGAKFLVDSAGSVFMPNLSNATKTNVIGFDTGTGELTFQPAGGGGGGISLPVPKVILMPGYPQGIQVLDSSTGNSAGIATVSKYPIVVAQDIPNDVLANYQVFVEMVHYKRKNQSNNGGVRKKRSGYVVESDLFFNEESSRIWRPTWPANFWNRNSSRHVTPQHDGGFASLGMVDVNINRPNWYEVTAQNQNIPVWQYLNSRYYEADVRYRDTTNNNVSLNTIIPVYGSRSAGKDQPTSRFPYSPLYTPLYIAFRYIVWNPNGGAINPSTELPYGEILSGPLSRVVKVSHQQFAFNYDYAASSTFGVACANVSALYEKWRLQCFFETRLP